jgi:hypothetical protein
VLLGLTFPRAIALVGYLVASYASRPLGIVQGAGDATLRARYAEELRSAAEASGARLGECWIVPGIEHTRAVIDERTADEPRLVALFTTALGAP